MAMIEHGRRSGSARRAVIGMLASAWLLSACAAPAIEDLEPKVELGPDVTVPASWVRPVDRCMHDAGFIATEVHEGTTGSNDKYGYTWETPTYFTWEFSVDAGGPGIADGLACRHAFAPYQAKSDDEVAVVYERWTKEHLCLADFGYLTPEPPTLEEFLDTWETGPWTPADAVRNPSQAARDACGLEMLE
jgi:hypothetical protein